jgi:hypothetical protein
MGKRGRGFGAVYWRPDGRWEGPNSYSGRWSPLLLRQDAAGRHSPSVGGRLVAGSRVASQCRNDVAGHLLRTLAHPHRKPTAAEHGARVHHRRRAIPPVPGPGAVEGAHPRDAEVREIAERFAVQGGGRWRMTSQPRVLTLCSDV